MEDKRIEQVVNDLYLFYRGIVAKKFTENVPAPHIQSLSKELMKLYRGDYHRLCVAMPPRHAKSSMISLAFPLWLIFHNPNLNILIINNSSELSMKFGLELREMFYEYGKYFNVYLSKLKQSQTFFKFCDSEEKLYSGSVRLVGASGSITGHDADYIIVDDPYKGLAEELTPTALQKKVDWFNIIVEQRIEPHTRIVILHTRWHPASMDTPILTFNRGWTTHGDLKVGDYVFQPNGKPTKVVKVHPPVPVDNCFEFANGDKIVTGDHHLWKIYDWGNRKEGLMETHKIMERPTLVGVKNTRSNFLVDNHEPLQYSHKEVPIDPYWFGLWLGDGHHKRPSISVDANDTISTDSTPYDVVRYDKGNGNCLDAFYTHQGLTEKLRELGVFGNKHIPDVYLHNSFDVRMELLAGLLDSDGSVEKSTNRVAFVNTNKTLLKQVHELITGLGFNVKVDERLAEATNKYKKNSNSLPIVSYGDAYALRFTPHLPIPTKVPRKKIEGDGVSKRVGLIDKYKVEEEIGNCITVEAEDGMYLIGKNLTPTHNSEDIQGWLKKNDAEAYKFIEYPAILEDGTPMWKERYKIEELEKKREVMGHRMFESIYQQHPLDDDTEFFDMRKVKYYDPQIPPLMTVRGWDIASADETDDLNDFTAGIKMCLLPNDEVLITDMVHGKFGGNVKNEILNTCYKDGMDTRVLIETGVAGAGKLLFAEYSEVLKPYIVEQALPVTSKVDRATPLANAVLDGKVYISIKDEEKLKKLKDEFNSFPAGVHDDIVDASAHCYNFLCRQDKGINPDILFIDL